MTRLLPALPTYGALLTALALSAAPVAAQQGVSISFGQSLRLDGSAIEVTADELQVDQTTGNTEFTGNVVVAQDEMRISAQSIRIEYSVGARTGSQRIGRLVASGGVTMVTGTEALEANEAIYSVESQRLEMTGEVMLVQGNNMLSGDRFVADLDAGTGQMIGRVRTIIRMD